MEAADDISYCLSDIEDGIEKNLLTHEQFINDLRARLAGQPEVLAIVDRAAQNSVSHGATVEAAIVFLSLIHI